MVLIANARMYAVTPAVTLLVSRFVAVDPTAYDVLVLRAQDGDRAGIARPE